MDLLLHQAREFLASVLLISESSYIPRSANWFRSLDDAAAIFINTNLMKYRCQLACAGPGFVAVLCGSFLLISIYFSPNLGLRQFNDLLNELSRPLLIRMDKTIICGDFNAKADIWGSSSTDGKGRLLVRWAAERDLRISNRGEIPTCVRPQGNSIIDLTWISFDLTRFIKDWKVREDIESMSDHNYITFDLCSIPPELPPNRLLQRRWNTKSLDEDLFQAVLLWRGAGPEMEIQRDVNKFTTWLDKTMEEACDASMKRIGPRRPRKEAYWWQESAAVLRRDCLRARRLLQKAKKRKRSQEVIVRLSRDYKIKRKKLRAEINRLKSIAWQELLNSLNEEPWGLSYKLVLGKLRLAALGLTEILDSESLETLLISLFPRNLTNDIPYDWSTFVWSDDWEVTIAFLSYAYLATRC
ncbi:uncharacterized protein [Polyergus mexicanus]|uniref:uncharacterized protein n=1 Tax=Polyergus mexicanus TaxID=615972 RepID=UPI0038B555DF